MGERRSLQSMAWRLRLPITADASLPVPDTHLIAALSTKRYETECPHMGACNDETGKFWQSFEAGDSSHWVLWYGSVGSACFCSH
jgi:hypothetical protein